VNTNAFLHRKNGYYLATAVALFGLIVNNFKTLFSSAWGNDALLWLQSVADGRASACLAVLAGVGITLYTEEERYIADLKPLKDKQKKLYLLSAALFVVGLMLAPLWPDEVVHPLAVALPLAVLLVPQSKSVLWAVAIGVAFAFTAIFLGGIDYPLSLEDRELSYEEIFTWQGIPKYLFFKGYYPFFPWAAFVLIGVWLGRLPVTEELVRNRVIVSAGAASVVGGVLSQFFLRFFPDASMTLGAVPVQSLFYTRPFPPSPFFVVVAAGTAVLILMVCISVAGRYGQSAWMRPMLAFGRMPLTIYVLHILAGLFLPRLLGLPQTLPIQGMVAYALVFLAACSAFAAVWSLRFRHGPIEWAARRFLLGEHL
jgi:uncharacterized protein